MIVADFKYSRISTNSPSFVRFLQLPFCSLIDIAIPLSPANRFVAGVGCFSYHEKRWMRFLLPKFLASAGQRRLFAVSVSVPKTTVDENYGSMFRKHDVGLSGKAFVVFSVPETFGEEGFSD